MVGQKLIVQPGSKIFFEDEPVNHILGTVYGRQYMPGQHEFKSSGLANIIHVYCDVVEHVAVGDSLVPCLRTMTVFNLGEEYIVARYENPYYIPLAKTEIAAIEIEFADDTGKTVSFGEKFSFIKLHFRPRNGIKGSNTTQKNT